jgi:CspA family cold shock protein
MSSRETGSVKWFDAKKGFGFITRENQEDVFIHFTGIIGDGYRILKDGQRVEFEIIEGKKGLEARNLSVIQGQEE